MTQIAYWVDVVKMETQLHVFGLNSPEWVRWWHRLQIDSFDGSKLSTEGAANGWYYVPMMEKDLVEICLTNLRM